MAYLIIRYPVLDARPSYCDKHCDQNQRGGEGLFGCQGRDARQELKERLGGALFTGLLPLDAQLHFS